MDTTDLPSLLRSHGLRATPQRLAVLAALQAAPDHPSAEEVFEEIREKMPSVSLATVYNALSDLRRVGHLRALPVSGRVRYDLTSRGQHDHLVCESCQRVVDLPKTPLPRLELPATQAEGFKILTAEVIFRSICPDCRALGTSEGIGASNEKMESSAQQETK